ncbi:alpha/beta hydrolase [Prosthecomicrobium pneumaticum]|uniref:Phospholipase/carboxylesterase n=1 Tax=Prosthecomicrobium pneumaticum TaxID=81895 RepID=A0A7W9FQB7_9HYPH|nr:dienelactone hydrolase family protein [Prosthecomicrobium pneumaticum]MBB5754918.1 phospholipase/carboxylesterase [Prosthecomicrobium pneumaticum]
MTTGGGPLRRGARGTAAKTVCVFVHGRGQSPEEIEAHVLARLAAPAVAFVLPRAPSGAWYEARAVDPLTPVARAQLSAATDHLAAALAAARAELPGLPLLLAGFSQGACLAIEYVCAGLPPPDALAAFTGCRVGVASDGRPEAAPRGLPVYLSGADADPWIPVAAFADAATSLGRAGAQLRADLFPGREHSVCDAEIAMLAGLLDDLAAGRRPRMEAAR